MSSSSLAGDAMDLTSSSPSSSSNKPPAAADANGKALPQSGKPSPPEQNLSAPLSAGMPAPPPAAVHQPKIVQTAFIHKLYK